MTDQLYEVYVEVFEITAWRGDTVYTTKSLGHSWVDKRIVDANKPAATNLIYASPSDGSDACSWPIRRKS